MLFQQLLAILLRHTACHTDNNIRIRTLHSLQLANLAGDFFLCTLTHAAGVDNNNIRCMKIGIGLIAKLLQLTCIMLCIRFIHLTAVINQAIGFFFFYHMCNTSIFHSLILLYHYIIPKKRPFPQDF